jgi:hypothetical protein
MKVFINSEIDYSGPALGVMLRLLHLHVDQLPVFTIGFLAYRAREIHIDGRDTIVRG